MLWFLIIFSAVTALFFRSLPFILKNTALFNKIDSPFYRFLNYSTQAMLGVIIYDTAFHNESYLSFIQTLNYWALLKIGLLLAVFIFVILTRRLFLAFLGGLLIYILAIFLGG